MSTGKKESMTEKKNKGKKDPYSFGILEVGTSIILARSWKNEA